MTRHGYQYMVRKNNCKPAMDNSVKHNKLFCIAGFFLMVLIFSGVAMVDEKNDKKGSKKRCDEITIVIDPGHGGFDPGKVGCDGIYEKDVNLQIAKKLYKKLNMEGFNVVMTRNDDIALDIVADNNKKVSDMRSRVEIINKVNPDIMISIHQNSYPDESVHGSQIFYSYKSQNGNALAEIMQDNLRKVDTSNKREAKGSKDYYVLNKTECTGVIVECGFLSNYNETKMLENDDYQNKLVEGIKEAVIKYFEIEKNKDSCSQKNSR